jgi:hypothetical protein
MLCKRDAVGTSAWEVRWIMETRRCNAVKYTSDLFLMHVFNTGNLLALIIIYYRYKSIFAKPNTIHTDWCILLDAFFHTFIRKTQHFENRFRFRKEIKPYKHNQLGTLKRAISGILRKQDIESSDTGQGPTTGFCEHGNENLGTINVW